jgi:hypothetical protein
MRECLGLQRNQTGGCAATTIITRIAVKTQQELRWQTAKVGGHGLKSPQAELQKRWRSLAERNSRKGELNLEKPQRNAKGTKNTFRCFCRKENNKSKECTFATR